MHTVLAAALPLAAADSLVCTRFRGLDRLVIRSIWFDTPCCPIV
jgi:hypothetical protein